MKTRHAGHGKLTIPGWLVLSVALLPALSAAASGGPWESVARISETALGYVNARFVRAGVEVEATVRSLDPHLKLARCDRALEAFATGPQGEARQSVVVGVRCRGARPWKIFVPVQMSVRRAVLVASRPMARGQVISAADVRLEKREITALRSACLTEPGQLAGKLLKRSVPEGGLITVDLLEEQDLVKRGQQVTLVVAKQGFTVRMTGTALGDATIHERVRVQNNSSGRTVEGIVRSHQLVEVITY